MNFIYSQPFKKSKTFSVDDCLWSQALSSFSISRSLIITCELHTAYSTVHFRNHHPLWLFHWIIFIALSLSLSLSLKVSERFESAATWKQTQWSFPDCSYFITSCLCFSPVSREVVMTTCRFQRLSCEYIWNLKRSFFRSSSNEPANRWCPRQEPVNRQLMYP